MAKRRLAEPASLASAVAGLLNQLQTDLNSSSFNLVNGSLPNPALVDQVFADLPTAGGSASAADLLDGLDQLLAGMNWAPNTLS